MDIHPLFTFPPRTKGKRGLGPDCLRMALRNWPTSCLRRKGWTPTNLSLVRRKPKGSWRESVLCSKETLWNHFLSYGQEKRSLFFRRKKRNPPPTTPGGGSSVSVGNTLNQEGRSDWFIIKLRNTGIQCFISYSKDRGAKSKKSSPYPEFIPLS